MTKLVKVSDEETIVQCPVKAKFDAAIASAHPKRARSLTNLWTALESMRTTKNTNFQYANVARVVESLRMDVPKYRTIINDPEKVLARLIDEYAAEYGNSPKEVLNEEDKLLPFIEDRAAMTQVRMLYAENRSLKKRLDIATNMLSKVEPSKTLPGEISQDVGLVSDREIKMLPASTNSEGKQVDFTAAETAAVKYFLEHMSALELAFDEGSGAMMAESELMEVAPPGFAQALWKIAKG